MKTIIIGAGPSGMMAAIQSSKVSDVLLLEKNEKVGKKLYITGKGRCNITNNADISTFIDQMNSSPFFMYSSFYTFSNKDTIDFFEKRNLKTKVERGGRVFPISDKSSDVIKVLSEEMKKNNVNLHLNEEVLSVKKDQQFIVKTKKDQYVCDTLIIATGGKTYPNTGSTGFGYQVAQNFGHKITKILPGLVPIQLKEDCTPFEGISLKNVLLKAYYKNRLCESLFGEMLFTKNGITGPVSLTLSSKIGDQEIDQIAIDLKASLDEKQLDQRLLREFDTHKNKNIENILKNMLLNALVEPVLNQATINPYKKAHEITRVERKKMIDAMKNLTFTYDKLYPLRYGIITNGGIETSEIDPQTMESKLVKGLYFVGEVIDVDAYTGGYNLQVAFSTGYTCGRGLSNDRI